MHEGVWVWGIGSKWVDASAEADAKLNDLVKATG